MKLGKHAKMADAKCYISIFYILHRHIVKKSMKV